VNVLALLPDSKEESSQYIQRLGLTIAAVPQVSFQKIDVRGTPTLFVVDSRGIVEKVWQGQLPDDEQKKVFSLLD
jgi:peroxiredoxin